MEKIYIHDLDSSFNKEEYIEKHLHNKNLEIEFHYVSDFKETKFLRDFIEIICKKAELEVQDVSRLILATDEMNNNAIEYGSQEKEKNIMRVFLKNKGKEIEIDIEVEDTGKGRKHRTAEEMEKLKEFKLKTGFNHHTSIRGRGLFMIIINIVDDLYFKDSESGGLIVGIKKSILL